MRERIDGTRPLCHYCHTPITTLIMQVALSPDLPVGSGYRVCSTDCPKLPEGAEVVTRRVL